MPTETKPRPIDANALLEEMKKLWNERPASPDDAMGFGIEESITKVKSAPTVETTDDVLARLPKNFRYTFETKCDTYEVWTRDSDSEHTLKLGYGNTPVEALKKLEASLNRK